MNFPASDVESVEAVTIGDGVERTRITTTFLGLYGVSSPLFSYFIEQISQADYQAWVNGFAQGIVNARAAVILEPDALGNLPSNCGLPAL